MKRIVSRWLVCGWVGLLATPAIAQQAIESTGVSVSGVLIDHTTKRPLPNGRLLAKTPTGNVTIGMSGDSGTFSGNLPHTATALLVERATYQSRLIPIGQADRRSSPVVVIPLLPVVAQAEDRPYQQTEQTAYVQENITRPTGQDSAAVQRGTFRVFDAIRDKPVQASVCFFFTKSGKKQCLTTDEAGLVSLPFRERDIVAIEATAPDYQPYAGNLVIDRLDKRAVQHAIPMARTLTLLAVDATGANRVAIRTGQQLVSLTAVQAGRFSAYDLRPGQYELIIKRGKQTVRQSIVVRSGLNWTSVTRTTDTLATPKTSRQVAQETGAVRQKSEQPLPFLDSIPLIYFEQSSYQLKPESQRILQQVAQYMNTHPACTLAITGHTDDVGDRSLNKILSVYRAMVTATFLTRQGVSDSRLQQQGFGGSQPLFPNDTEANRALNRRVFLKLTATP
jgi:outer membrane protein OmpA-like peptidoglycan-associated protein